MEPFALPNNGWPIRENELPVDPLSLRCVAEYFRPAGLQDGLMCALVTGDGRYVGFHDISSGEAGAPSDEACAVIGNLAPTLATFVDPLQSALRLASTTARGGPVPEELMAPESQLRAVLARVLAGGRPSARSCGWTRAAVGIAAARSAVATAPPSPPSRRRIHRSS